jgi:ADP-heptose:LPS heptosyltransferase
VRRLVVARTDRLGDLMLTLPAVDALRCAYPGVRLELLVDSALTEVAMRFDGVDEVWETPPTTAALAAKLRERAPDAIICIARTGRLAVAAARAGIRHRLGAARRFYSPLFTRTVGESRRSGDRHEVEYALSFAHRVGAMGAPARFPIKLRPEDLAGARSWMQGHGLSPGEFVVLHPGSGGSCPRWPMERFAELAALHRSRGISQVWSVGPGESAPAAAEPLHRGSLPSLAALLRASAGIVASSTGPIHLAAALGRPALSIHAPWASCGVQRWGPYGGGGAGVVAAAEGASQWSRAERRAGASELMRGVPAGFVFEAARDLFDV